MQSPPHAQRARAPRRRLPRGRPRAVRRAAARRRPRRTRSRSSRAARRSATRCTSRRRTATSRRATELMDQMIVLLGGRAAEELVFGAITTGASDDLQQVAEISRSMIHEWAMGTSVSALQLAAEGGAVSDRTRELRDAEQQHLADEAMRRAVEADHRPPRAARRSSRSALLRHEVLEREDIDAHHGRRRAPRAGRGGHLRVAAADADKRPTGLLSGSDDVACGRSPETDGRRRRLPGVAGARRDPRRLPADRPARRPAADRLRGPGALPHAARPGRAAAGRDARRRGAAGLRDDLEVACWAAIAAAGAPPARAAAVRQPRRPRRSATPGCSSSPASCPRGS